MSGAHTLLRGDLLAPLLADAAAADDEKTTEGADEEATTDSYRFRHLSNREVQRLAMKMTELLEDTDDAIENADCEVLCRCDSCWPEDISQGSFRRVLRKRAREALHA